MNILKEIIRETIDDLNGLAFGSSLLYSPKDKIFFEDRYLKIVSLLPEIKKDDVGLEIGLCGGILAFSLKRIFFLEKLYTLEHPITCKQFTREYLSELKRNRIIFKQVDLHNGKLPWVSKFFNFVIFSDVLEHLIPADIPAVFKEINRVLKKNGWLLVTTPNISSLIKRIKLLLGKSPIGFDLTLHENATYGHIREYTMNESISLLQSEGFTIVRKNYYMIDVKRSFFTRLEFICSKILPGFANSIGILARKP